MEHPLADLVASFDVHRSYDPPSWNDVQRIRAFVGDDWARLREDSSDYDLATLVLAHLVSFEAAAAAVAPYLEIYCTTHGATAGKPCAESRDRMFPDAARLPALPTVCSRRVLAAHKRDEAAEILERSYPRGAVDRYASREVLPIAAEVDEDGRVLARAQYRDPRNLVAERLVIAHPNEWTIRDVRLGETSAFAPHGDLPGALFSNHVTGPFVPLPSIVQDQWVEVVALFDGEGPPPRFHAVLTGRVSNP